MPGCRAHLKRGTDTPTLKKGFLLWVARKVTSNKLLRRGGEKKDFSYAVGIQAANFKRPRKTGKKTEYLTSGGEAYPSKAKSQEACAQPQAQQNGLKKKCREHRLSNGEDNSKNKTLLWSGRRGVKRLRASKAGGT